MNIYRVFTTLQFVLYLLSDDWKCYINDQQQYQYILVDKQMTLAEMLNCIHFLFGMYLLFADHIWQFVIIKPLAYYVKHNYQLFTIMQEV